MLAMLAAERRLRAGPVPMPNVGCRDEGRVPPHQSPRALPHGRRTKGGQREDRSGGPTGADSPSPCGTFCTSDQGKRKERRCNMRWCEQRDCEGLSVGPKPRAAILTSQGEREVSPPPRSPLHRASWVPADRLHRASIAGQVPENGPGFGLSHNLLRCHPRHRHVPCRSGRLDQKRVHPCRCSKWHHFGAQRKMARLNVDLRQHTRMLA